LTCSATAIPHLNNGNPVWHPSGNYIALQVQHAPSLGKLGDLGARPGAGWNNDLWIMDAAGKRYWQITHVTTEGGVVHPQFSWAGDKIVWAERISSQPAIYGTWQLKLGDFVVAADGTPSVQNIKTFTPGTQKLYYEPHGFSRDDKTLFFMAYLEPGQTDYGMDIYSLDLVSNKLARLTDTLAQWDEFPTPMPFGAKLVWMSTMRTASTPNHFEGDLWVMNYDGSDKYQLTFFNDPTSPDYQPDGIALADPDWNADGTQLAVYVNPGKGPAYPGPIWILNIEPPGK
jgi:Tol biopolymer transport system component